MAQPNQKLNDCYFYFYSTCKKGDACFFRHCEAALGTEFICPNWRVGKCLNEYCPLRHMESAKNRDIIPCYWENQPGGCRKPHCVFKHSKFFEGGSANSIKDNLILPVSQNMEESMLQDTTNVRLASPKATPLTENENESELSSVSLPQVEPLVVNFDEESDTESCTNSANVVETNEPREIRPKRTIKRIAKSQNENGDDFDIGIKTLEQIRREKDLMEPKMEVEEPVKVPLATEEDLRHRIKQRLRKNKNSGISNMNLDFEVKTLDEIKREKSQITTGDSHVSKKSSPNRSQKRPHRDRELYQPPSKKVPLATKQVPDASNDNVRVKTLAEIREERKLRFQETAEKPVESETKLKGITLKRRLDGSVPVPVPNKKINLRKSSVDKKSEVYRVSAVSDNDEMDSKDHSDIVKEQVDEDDLDFLLGDEEEFTSADVKEDDLLSELDNLINS